MHKSKAEPSCVPQPAGVDGIPSPWGQRGPIPGGPRSAGRVRHSVSLGGREPLSLRPTPGAGLLALPFGISSTAQPALRLRFQLPPAPAGTGCPGWGGTVPAAGASVGPVPKRAWEHRHCEGRRVFLARCSVPHGQRKRLILTLGRWGLGWGQRCPAPRAVRTTQSLARCHPKVPSPRFGEPFFFVRPPSCTWPRPCETLTRAPACGTGGEGRAVPAPGQPCRRSFQYFWLCCSCHPAPRPCPATLRRAGEQQEPLGCRGRPVR